jgi:SAM-dependent methyltransferase
MKRRYIEGCEPDHLESYLGRPLNKYIHGARYRSIMDLLPRKGSILDAGCGYGVFELSFLSQRKEFSVVGGDVSGKAVRSAKDRNPTNEFVQCDIEFLPFQNRAFDCVVATEVIEHVPNAERALEEIKRVSKDLLVATVPNVLNPSFLRAVGRSYVPEFKLFSNLFSKLGFLDFQLSNLRWIVLGFVHVSNKDFFDFKHYFGNVHRLYKPNFFLLLLEKVNLELISVRGTTLIPQFLPKQATALIQFLSPVERKVARRRWELSLVITALCGVR